MINTKKTTWRHIQIKMLENKDQEKILAPPLQELFFWPHQVLVVAHEIFPCDISFPRSSMWAPLLLDIWDLSSPVRDWSHIPYIARQVLNHWTTKEVSWTVKSSCIYHSKLERERILKAAREERHIMYRCTNVKITVDLSLETMKGIEDLYRAER